MRFCTSCGHGNDDDSAFCQECGAALRPKAAAAAQPVTAGVPAGGKRTLAIAASVIGVLIAAGAAAWFFLMPPAASERNFAAAVQKHLDAHPDLVRETTCLRNFRYDRDPAAIAEHDSRGRKWFDMLVEAGLYEAPQPHTTSGWFAQKQLHYRQTEAGKKAIHGNRLCFAEGLRVKSVAAFTPPQAHGDLLVSRADVILEYRDPASWSRSQTARELANGLDREQRRNWTLVRTDGQWKVADAETLGAIRFRSGQSMPMQAQAEDAAAAAPDWWSRIKNYFSATVGGNPLIGTWETSMMGVIMLQYEFTADSMRVGDAVTPVRYEVKENEVVVYPEGQGTGLIVKVIDEDNIELNVGVAAVKFKRVK